MFKYIAEADINVSPEQSKKLGSDRKRRDKPA